MVGGECDYNKYTPEGRMVWRILRIFFPLELCM